ncbi:MAG: HAMP domain-containing sensor histidine kinase [Microthrixaceae bacterium]|nr:HAMP domain-containing sensor histidine kinase [Microthrixaceae bacterium]HMT23738.1 HAMP domain-containing sensor histidine kinase [Microthrixaceae bacterium]HMT61574.1 HAMP domain-containing sensor histidine kinase [Microthrixaceae bacterium]
MTDSVRTRPFSQLGLRARITATFMFGALLVAVLLSLASVTLSRSNLLDQRERVGVARAAVNAAAIGDKIVVPDVDAQTLFGSLSVSGKPSALVPDASAPDGFKAISLDPRFAATAVPTALRRGVLADREPKMMRYESNGEPLLAVGVPILDGTGVYFEVNQLSDISRSINSLALTLIGASAAAAVLGGSLGYWGSRRLLRPLADVSSVAEAVAQGRLDARLAYSEWAEDPDLAQLVSSFNEMVAALQGRIDRDARFASDVSHELRSPLTTFSASLEVLRNAREEMPERAQIALDLLSSDMERFTQLVEDLLEISRFDAGAVRLDPGEVLIVETLRMAVRALASEPVPVDAEADLEDLVIVCDKRRLIRVLANFIDNARKYGGGATRVAVERLTPERSEDDDETEDDDPSEVIRIAVEDSGPGVPEADREQIFDRFNRGSLGGSRGTATGVGLGLSLAAEHARLQGGRVWVEPRPDHEPGARFVIELPLVEPADDDVDGLDAAVATMTSDELTKHGTETRART